VIAIKVAALLNRYAATHGKHPWQDIIYKYPFDADKTNELLNESDDPKPGEVAVFEDGSWIEWTRHNPKDQYSARGSWLARPPRESKS
jgi:hypothetical protein